MNAELKIEFHAHTKYSGDSLNSLEGIIQRCRKIGLDRIVITDHNNIQGAVEAQKMEPELVIVGEEVLCQEGELLAAFVREKVPMGLQAKQAIEILKSQGAFISVSHPFDRLRSGGWDESDLLDILPEVDAIEVFNSRCFPRYFNQQAIDFAAKHNIAGTVGSDAHALLEIGRATMTLPNFDDAEGLRKVISKVKLQVIHTGPWVRLYSRYAVLRKQISNSKRE